MTRTQLDAIPEQLLIEPGTEGLRTWLHARGLTMTCLELVRERRRRGIGRVVK